GTSSTSSENGLIGGERPSSADLLWAAEDLAARAAAHRFGRTEASDDRAHASSTGLMHSGTSVSPALAIDRAIHSTCVLRHKVRLAARLQNAGYGDYLGNECRLLLDAKAEQKATSRRRGRDLNPRSA